MEMMCQREGYTFDGWYLDADLKEKADPTLSLTEDQTVYAKWKGTLVGYKAVYLTENADDDNYSYAGTVDLRAVSGTTVQADGGTQNHRDLIQNILPLRSLPVRLLPQTEVR